MWVPNREWGLFSIHPACSDDSFGLILIPRLLSEKKKIIQADISKLKLHWIYRLIWVVYSFSLYWFFRINSVSPSVVPDSVRPHGLQPIRLFCPWDFPGKDTGVGFHLTYLKFSERFSCLQRLQTPSFHSVSQILFSQCLEITIPLYCL